MTSVPTQTLPANSSPATKPQPYIPNLGRSVGRGILAGIVGGLIFGAAATQFGMLETVALLVRTETPIVGFFIHLIIAGVIGGGFGLLVAYHKPDPGETLFWGLTYGALWWFIGAMTLLPILAGQTMTWQIGNAQALVPALIGHLVYGAVIGLVLALDRPTGPASSNALARRSVGAVVRGGLSGLAGSAILGAALNNRLGLPAVSDAMADESRPLAWVVTLALGILSGAGFALLFPANDRGTGPTLIRGVCLLYTSPSPRDS